MAMLMTWFRPVMRQRVLLERLVMRLLGDRGAAI